MKKTLWKKSAAVAALGAALLIHGGAAHAATVYKATDDDTFWSLSRKFNVDLKQLMAANPKVDPRNIYSGIKITIPDDKQEKLVKAASVDPESRNTGISMANASDEDGHSITVDGRQLEYSNVIQAKASVYTAAASENGGWGPVDYYGNPLKIGTVAVDPSRIPLGSKMYITGYDYDGLPQGGMMAVATDIGGAIKGDRVDIFVADSRAKALAFGFQYVKVFVLE